METNDEFYIKGFNHGYVMAQHEPELLAQLLNATPQTDYLEGMKDGKKQHEKEQAKEMLHQKMKHSKDQSKEQDR
jgi:hypothetical protein